MTLSTLDLEEVKKHLPDQNLSPGLETIPTSDEIKLTGQILSQRLGGLISLDNLDLVEAHINESCEQEND